TYLTYPFTENNWSPLIYAFIFSLLMVIMAFVLENARDMGAGYLPQREGRGRANKTLLSIPGLFFKLNKATIISWLIDFFFFSGYICCYLCVYADLDSKYLIGQSNVYTIRIDDGRIIYRHHHDGTYWFGIYSPCGGNQ